MNKLLPFTALFLTTLLFAGCYSTATIKSNLVASSEIYHYYAINANQGGMTATAIFRVGGATGTTVDFDSPAKIEFNGKQMDEYAPWLFKGTDYGLEQNKFSRFNEFVLTASDGSVYRNSVELEPLEFSINDANFDLSKELEVPVTRIPAEIGESVSLTLTNEDFVKSSAEKIEELVPFSFNKSKNTIVLGPVPESKLTDKQAAVKMQINRTPALKEPTRIGGYLTASYHAKPLKVSIIK